MRSKVHPDPDCPFYQSNVLEPEACVSVCACTQVLDVQVLTLGRNERLGERDCSTRRALLAQEVTKPALSSLVCFNAVDNYLFHELC